MGTYSKEDLLRLVEEEVQYLRPDPETFAILPWRPQYGKEAHRFLQKRSMERGVRLIESARWVIDSYTI